MHYAKYDILSHINICHHAQMEKPEQIYLVSQFQNQASKKRENKQ